MTSKEVESMIHFLYRPEMYITKAQKTTVVTFMNGADFGKLAEPYWTYLLTQFLEVDLKIMKPALGWPHQVEVYSKNNQKDWFNGFKEVMLQMIEQSDQIPYTTELKRLKERYSGN
ncbi:MAG: hypothetical protein HEP71_12995 [Roseivirga sp.]|nr:hypothetical protein [Roseivirga sp.]